MFGLQCPNDLQAEKGREPDVWWGMRAEFKPLSNGLPIRYCHDRVSWEVSDGTRYDALPFLLRWAEEKGFPALLENPEFLRLRESSADVVQMYFKDSNAWLQVSPNGSYGYLYIGAWMYWPDACRYFLSEIPTDERLAWSHGNKPPAVNSRVSCSMNGPWTGGIVLGYFVEHGYLGIEVDFSEGTYPDYYPKQNGDLRRGCMFGVDLVEVADGTS